MIGTPGETHSAWRHLIGPTPLGVLAARRRLPAAALAQPIDEPSCRQRGQQGCDDHAHADEYINGKMAVPLSMFMAARISSRSCSMISGG
jgi:hypothetical protein